MNEKEWLECTDPTPMLEFLRGKASDRKLRLFAAARCRLFQLGWSDRWPTREAVDAAEQWSDGCISGVQLARFHQSPEEFDRALAANDVNSWGGYLMLPSYCLSLMLVQELSSPSAPSAARGVLYDHLRLYVPGGDWETNHERLAECRLLRDVFDNLVRLTTPLPPAVLAWNDGTVRRIGEGIYEERAFDRLPILADALQDASCDDADILAHCRSEGPHVRGCWVVDLLLGKE